jgi:hypothetical protein
MELITTNYYWPKMKNDVKNYVQACRSCAMRKVGYNRKVSLSKVKKVTRPFELISLDIVDPLNTTTSGKKYILTCIDQLSRYAEAIPLSENNCRNNRKSICKQGHI